MKNPVNENELNERIEKSFNRFDDVYYRIEGIFQEYCADWPGDKEGRALLAFVSHYRISGRKIPCMEQMIEKIPSKTNEFLYFDPPTGEKIHEQQLSGHSWYLRGLCEHYEQSHDDFSLKALKSVTEHLYLPLRGRISTYPVERDIVDRGGVSGNFVGLLNGWILSSDTGCAFMSLDGISHVYKITHDERVKALFDEMFAKFASMDKVSMRLQTHCTLTAARGMIRMYQETGESAYLEEAKNIYNIYTRGGGMTYTYQNLNWWGRPDTWTEPCAIVDSLMLAGELYKITGQEAYRKCAARIFCNGFATAQRPNGGAGTDKVVLPGQPWLAADMPEAFFCCTMRLAEGLRYAWENKDILYTETDDEIKPDGQGRYADGDVLYAELDGESADKYNADAQNVDGHKLVPILKYYKINADDMYKIRQKIIFDEKV